MELVHSPNLDLTEVGPAVADKGPGALSGGCKYDPFGVWGPQVPRPVVMAVSGISFTLSIELALASDVVVASKTVRFRQLEVGRGILPFGGATMRAPARLGWGNAMRFLLTGEEFGAAEALRIGLVQEVVEPGQHVARATCALGPPVPAGRRTCSGPATAPCSHEQEANP